MVLIPSTINQWPQDEQQSVNMASIETRVIERPTQQQQITQESLKCPRCDSLNTKFCYYNNYSLTQPRHFCKACKRYWTRGGTLRNVPVGGGYRRNKKIRRSISSVDLHPSSSSSPTSTSSNPNTTQTRFNPIFFGLPTKPNTNSEIGTLPYPTFNSRVLSADAVLGFEIQPQMNSFGLGFSNHQENYQNGSTNPLHSSYSLMGSSANSATIASLLGSSLNQKKFINNTNCSFQGLGSFEEGQLDGNISLKVKREEGQKLQNYQNPNFLNYLDQMHPSDSSLYWSAANVGSWLDPTNNINSSVPSLI